MPTKSIKKFNLDCKKVPKLTLLLTIFAIIPQISSQSTELDQFNTVFGTCIYNYTQQTIYTCDLSNVRILNPTDVLTIIGTHLPGHTDADVHAVNYVNSTIAFFNGEVLRKFTNLRRILIFNQGLRQFRANAFEFCPHLEELLTAMDNELTSYPPQMLRNCHNLQTFVAVSHSLTSIPEDLFGATANLREFSVGDNQLTSLPENLLQNMANLRSINIANNLISNLSPNLVRNAANLEHFAASNNRFVDQQSIINTLNNRLELRRILIVNNNFTNFDFRFFAQFQRLTEISIGSASGPRLTGISWQSLPSSLTSLRVEGIGENIAGNGIGHLINLGSLTLSGLGITNLHRDTLSTLSRLQFLTIQNTNIRSLDSELFRSQANLLNLNLNNNQIEELPNGVFAPLVSIGNTGIILGLRLASNNLQRLNADAFGQHPQLQYIDFFGNRINEIERGIFSRFNPILDYAGFRGNLCISQTFFNAVNLDNDQRFTLCFNNHAGITTTTTTTTTTEASNEIPTTTPDGSESNFRRFEVLLIILIGFLISLIK